MEILGAKWTDILQCALTAGGFWLVWSQIKDLRRSTEGNTYASLYGEYMDMCKLFIKKPQLRAYFYHAEAGAPEMPAGGEARQQVEAMCELMTGLLEHATLQQMNIPPNIWEECWQKFTYDRFNESPAMKSYWERNRHLYAREFREVVDNRVGARAVSSTIP